MPIADAIKSIFSESRPAKLRRWREKYGAEKIKLESDGQTAPSFEDWLKERGVDLKGETT